MLGTFYKYEQFDYKLCCAFYKSIALALAYASPSPSQGCIATIEATEATASVEVSALA